MTYKTQSWDLSEIKPKENSFDEIEELTKSIEDIRKELTNNISSTHFNDILKILEILKRKSSKIACYTHLRFTQDTTNQEYSANLSKVETALTKISNRLIFFSIWFKNLPDKKADELIQNSGDYKYYLEQLRKTKHYTLKENEEKIINLKDVTGSSALITIYDKLTSKFTYEFEGKQITQEELISYVRNNDPQIREKAYKTLLEPFVEQKDVIGEIYKNLINDWREENVYLRGYKNPINVRNIDNDIPDNAVESLLKVCKKNFHIFQQFFEIKRKKLNLPLFSRFDLYAPIKQSDEKISYDKAVDMILKSFGKFSNNFMQEAKNILDANHVHSTVQKHKRSGAFCSSVTAKINPYILLSYTGKLRDVSTLAHELGHGVHHKLASNHNEFLFHSSLPLAETASIFAEMLLSDYLLEKDPKKAKEMIFSKVDDLYASIVRQAGFVIFEKTAHKMIEEGKTIEEISQEYYKQLKEQLGPIVELDKIFSYEWCYIPHIFHTPFYCYAYSFGNLLVLALYEMYKEQGETFVPKIMNMLSKGGSLSPIEITREIGVDITSEEFWQKGFEVIKKMIKELE